MFKYKAKCANQSTLVVIMSVLIHVNKMASISDKAIWFDWL